ncbi:MAG: hypothetical protein F4Z51_07350 [Chloroflexi bacterium]|nr:hypothetical protein [Chloroflexota bacterium]MYD16413.1 hypothetical protein [Chloroflexota bacterium]
MVLEDLHELIETLQARIDAHGPALQQSEALTRYALIDPLLRGLGWDTGDPSQVMPEYRSAAGSADYALLGMAGKPRIIIEAKKLGTQLDFKVRQQVTGYCQEEGIPYAVITDGRFWELYDVFKPVAMKDSIVTTLDLGDAPAKTTLKALALWRPNASMGTVTVGATPLVESSEAPPVPEQPVKKAAQPMGLDWQPLSDFKPQGGTKPAEVSFPDATVVVALSWANLIAEIVRWLKSGRYLSDSDLPIKFAKANSYFANTTNDKGNGQPFQSFRVVDGWHIHTNYNAAAHMNNARGVIQRAGLNPADFAVRLQ